MPRPDGPRRRPRGRGPEPANKDGKPCEDADLALIIKNGAAAYGGSPMMAPWGATLSDQDVQNVIAYVRSLKQ